MKLLALMSCAGRPPSPPGTLWPWPLAAARRSGLHGEVGTLGSGKWADLCCAISAVRPLAPARSRDTIGFCGGRDIVSDVWVAGASCSPTEKEMTRLDWPSVAARRRRLGRAIENWR